MAQNLLIRKEFLNTNDRQLSVFGLVESIKKHIFEHDCARLSMDISHLNILDASRVAVLCSTYHYAKYPHGEINWIVNSHEVKNLVKPLNLGNINFIQSG